MGGFLRAPRTQYTAPMIVRTDARRASRRRIVRALAAWVYGCSLITACTGGPGGVSDLTVSGGGSSGSSGGSSGTEPLPSPSTPTSPPVVRCVSEEIDGGEGGVDASSGASDGGVDGSEEAGSCLDLADECTSPVQRTRYRSGRCVSGSCQWDLDLTECPGGCFRQLDGGVGCRE